MIPLSPALLVATANAFVGLGEEGGDNRGQMVELFLKEVKLPAGQPWCAAFVHHIGYWSHYDIGLKLSSWPLRDTASCEVLARDAKEAGVLKNEPEAGDVFLLYSKELKRFHHTGVIAEISSRRESRFDVSYVCETIEGNTNSDGSANGYTTLRRVRTFVPSQSNEAHKFIRWVDLDGRRQTEEAA